MPRDQDFFFNLGIIVKTLFKKSASALIVGSLISVFSVADVSASEEIMKKSGCPACHLKDKKLVGPAFKDIAAKYRNDPKAIDFLTARVRAGGKGVWSPVPMLPMDKSKVSDADLRAAVGWVLKQ
jgi:cytochrome c